MKILLILRGFNKQGGAGRYVAELAEHFVQEHETHLLTTDYDYDLKDLIVHKKPMIRKPFWLQILSNTYYNTKYSKKIKEQFGIDVVHSQGGESPFCDVLTMHSCNRAWFKHYLSWGLMQKVRSAIDPSNHIALAIERHVLEKGSKKIISVSEGVKREILENYDVPKEKIEVIPNGVDLEEFKPDVEKREKIRMKYGVDENDVVLMFSGYEFKRKGLRYIIEALPEIKENVKLLVVGRDNPRRYQELASKLGVLDKIIFTGFVPEIVDYYVASDIFVFPTLYEPFGLVISEALASAIPVITSKLAGAAEIMKNEYDGFLLDDPTNSEDIAEKVNLLVEDENLREQMGKNARKTAEKYSWDEIAKRTLKVYEGVAKN